MTVWHWVRHGPTHAKNFVGWRDVPADLTDEEHLTRLRQTLPGRAILLSSDLDRARKTANALQSPDHVRLPDDPHLREIHFGLWDGMHFSDVALRDPTLSREFWERPGSISSPSGESWNDAMARVSGVVQRMNHRYPDAEIIVAAHFGVILTQVQHAGGTTAYEALGHKIDNLSVTTISWENGQGRVGAINHLP